MTDRQYQFGFVGCGPVARYHADVIRALGHVVHAVCTRAASPRRAAFVDEYGVARSYDRLGDLLDDPAIDALVVATPWHQTEDVVDKLADTRIPCLVEKPVAVSAERLERLLDRAPVGAGRMLVGYNRRFYDFIPDLQDALASGRLLSIDASFPDALRPLAQSLSPAITDVALAYVTSHGLDLLEYLVGDLQVTAMHRQLPLGGGGYGAYNGLLYAAERGVPIHLQVQFDAPCQHVVSFNFEDRIYRLSPIERLTVYRGLDRLEPAPDHPIRRYVPRVERIVDVDTAFKPGFYGQMANFIDTCVAGLAPNTRGCTLAEALRVLKLCESIDGRQASAFVARGDVSTTGVARSDTRTRQ